MPITIEAIYENGVLKPAQPLPFQEHEQVRITVEPKNSCTASSAQQAADLARLLAHAGAVDLGRPTEADNESIDTDLARELATYERHRAALERDHPGEFAIIRNSELVGVFKEEQEALAEGARRFGLGKFLLMEVGDPIYSFPNCVLPETASH
jgi:predicted DNA-binding antitoxin AbrB/MazE fold protein